MSVNVSFMTVSVEDRVVVARIRYPGLTTTGEILFVY